MWLEQTFNYMSGLFTRAKAIGDQDPSSTLARDLLKVVELLGKYM